MRSPSSSHLGWPEILERASAIAGYDTGLTLRQLFYRLFAAELLPNSRVAYQGLSSWTAEARRRGVFPALIDRTRSIHQRDFLERAGCFDEVRRVALTSQQVEEFNLPEQMGKTTDSRAGRFVARHGRLVQVELDALPPDVLQGLFAGAIGEFWDKSAFEAAVEKERAEARRLGRAS